MFALSVTICEEFPIEICMTLTLTFRMSQYEIKCASGNALCNFLFVGNTNVCPICHRL